MKQTGEYTLEISQARIHQSAAERIVMEQVVEDTKSKHHEVIISGSLLIFVPKWSTTIQFKDCRYTRQALAASKTILLDEIEFCSRDYLSSSLLRKPEVRKTFAVCDDCGMVLCRKHILVVDERYVCSENTKPVKSIGAANKNSRFNIFTSKVKSVKASSLYNSEKFSGIGSRIFSDQRVIRNATSRSLSPASSDGKSPSTQMKSDTRYSIFSLDPSASSNDLHKTQETINREDYEASPAKKITKYTSDGKPLKS
ncbi:MAG: hypothetical protein WBL67_14560 [Nitrososphaeraceae archaeon]